MFRVNHKELARLRHGGGGAGAIRSKTISTHSEESLTATCILSVINWEGGGGEGLGRWGGGGGGEGLCHKQRFRFGGRGVGVQTESWIYNGRGIQFT